MQKHCIALVALVVAFAFAFGCGNNKQPQQSSSVTDIGPVASTQTPSAAPQPVPAPQPVYDTTPGAAVSSTPAAAGGTTYTVKRGDTLYRIAQDHYGDGKQWKKIQAANPGLTPDKLKAGQTINLP